MSKLTQDSDSLAMKIIRDIIRDVIRGRPNAGDTVELLDKGDHLMIMLTVKLKKTQKRSKTPDTSAV